VPDKGLDYLFIIYLSDLLIETKHQQPKRTLLSKLTRGPVCSSNLVMFLMHRYECSGGSWRPDRTFTTILSSL
jgi:hypothetical protein